jgi:hypothetical protein
MRLSPKIAVDLRCLHPIADCGFEASKGRHINALGYLAGRITAGRRVFFDLEVI